MVDFDEEYKRRVEVEAYKRFYLSRMYKVEDVLEFPIFSDVVSGGVVDNFDEIVIEGVVDRVKMYEEGKGWVMIEQEVNSVGDVIWSKFVRVEMLELMLQQYQLGEYRIDGLLYWEIERLIDDPTGYVVKWWRGKEWEEVEW